MTFKMKIAAILIGISPFIMTGSAYADQSFRGGSFLFEQAARDYGRLAWQGARNYGSRAMDTFQSFEPVRKGFSGVSQSRNLLKRGSPLPLIIIPKGYTPGVSGTYPLY